jgi:hypothetical protein
MVLTDDCWCGGARRKRSNDDPAMTSRIYFRAHDFTNKNKQQVLRPQRVNMPSRGNPNVPNKQRRIASRRKVQKKNAINKVTKNPRGMTRSSVLHPTSGPLAPISKKKARKLERAQNHARARAIEKVMILEGEAEMIGEFVHTLLRQG